MADPAYLRVADDLRRRIHDGTIPPGARFPSQAEITETYEVSSPTAWEARRVLVQEGLIEGRSGSGTYVRPRPTLHRLARAHYQAGVGRGSPFRVGQADAGRVGDWESASETTDAPPPIAERLGIEPGDRCIRTEYVFRADGQPVMLSTSWEPYALTGHTEIIWPEDGPHAGRGVVERMAEIDIAITSVLEEVTARLALASEAHRLGGVIGALVIDIQRTYYTEEGRAIETADIVVPADRYRVSYHLPVK